MHLHQLLKQKNISAYRLWKESGIPQSTISDICTGKTKIEKCSAETIYRIAKALDVTMESLVESAMKKPLEEVGRTSFELFKSNTCHRVKDMGDIAFSIELLRSNEIRSLYDKKWYPEALYLLAMLDYLSKENDIPICTNYNDIRCMKLEKRLYPANISILCKTMNSEEPKIECMKQAIPEFLRFNIVECEVRNVF